MQLALAAMPQAALERILSYREIKDQQSRLAGRLLLAHLLRSLELPYTLADVRTSATHKPYLGAGVDFSITHTEGWVACAATTVGQIGIDAEHRKNVKIADYLDSLSDDEKRELSSPESHLSFWDIWTRKEAVAKASGMGIEMDWPSVDVCADRLTYLRYTYHLRKLDIGANIVAHLAVSEDILNKVRDIEIIRGDTATLLARD